VTRSSIQLEARNVTETQPKSSLGSIYAKFGAKFSDIEREKQRLFFNYVFPRENSLQYKQHGG